LGKKDERLGTSADYKENKENQTGSKKPTYIQEERQKKKLINEMNGLDTL
jgi:hypothetical protein